MSYEFKAGDEGLLRDGVTKYKIIAIVAGMTRPIIVRKDNGEEIVQRYPDGRVAKHTDSRTDLMPPTKIVYDVYYEYVKEPSSAVIGGCWTFKNLKDAQLEFERRSKDHESYKNVKLTPREVQPE